MRGAMGRHMSPKIVPSRRDVVMGSAKTAELIKMLFTGLTRCGLKEQCISWVSTLTPPGEYD